MEPLPNRRGNLKVVAEPPGRAPASMEPLPNRRGNPLCTEAKLPLCAASMEPLPNRRGNMDVHTFMQEQILGFNGAPSE